jgi:hypothetical protein
MCTGFRNFLSNHLIHIKEVIMTIVIIIIIVRFYYDPIIYMEP